MHEYENNGDRPSHKSLGVKRRLHEDEKKGDLFSDKWVRVNRRWDEGGKEKVSRTDGLRERRRATTVPWIRARARGGLGAKFIGNVRTKKDLKQFERRDGFGTAELRGQKSQAKLKIWRKDGVAPTALGAFFEQVPSPHGLG